MIFYFSYKVIHHIKVKIRKKIFKLKTSTNHDDFTLYGGVNLLNTDVKIGHHVQIYPNATFWGTGHIEIGNDCSIGMGTVIFASKAGGNYWESYTYRGTSLYY